MDDISTARYLDLEILNEESSYHAPRSYKRISDWSYTRYITQTSSQLHILNFSPLISCTAPTITDVDLRSIVVQYA